MTSQLAVSIIHGLEDVWPVRLRADDAMEVAKAGLTVEQAIAGSVSHSTKSFAVRVEGVLMCVWGYRRCGSAADIWLLTTEEVERHPFAFIRESRRLLHILLDQFSEIRCEVAVDYTRTRKWLHRIGFAEVGDSQLQPGFIIYRMGGTASGRSE